MEWKEHRTNYVVQFYYKKNELVTVVFPRIDCRMMHALADLICVTFLLTSSNK